MYKIVGSKLNDKFEYFMNAFIFQQKNYPENYIIYDDGNGFIEIVWNPNWENISADELENGKNGK